MKKVNVRPLDTGYIVEWIGKDDQIEKWFAFSNYNQMELHLRLNFEGPNNDTCNQYELADAEGQLVWEEDEVVDAQV